MEGKSTPSAHVSVAVCVRALCACERVKKSLTLTHCSVIVDVVAFM